MSVTIPEKKKKEKGYFLERVALRDTTKETGHCYLPVKIRGPGVLPYESTDLTWTVPLVLLETEEPRTSDDFSVCGVVEIRP